MFWILTSLYRYHSRNFNKDNPYLATLFSVFIIILTNWFTLLEVLEQNYIMDFWNRDSKSEEYLIAALICLPATFILSLLFPKSKIKEKEKTLTKQKYRIGLFIYILLLICSLQLMFFVVEQKL